MSVTRTVVPAHPGWFVCTPVWIDHECNQLPEISRDPVIAWLVTVSVSDDDGDTACYYAHPVTDELRDDDEDLWLVRPDGRFVQPERRTTFDEDEVRQFMLEDQQRHLARSG